MIRHFILILFLILTHTASSQTVDDRTGILIYYNVNDKTFPTDWTTDKISPTGISLDSLEIERSLNIIKKAFNKYPKEVLEQNLKKIYILKTIKFYGQKFGGTNSLNAVYISNDGVLQGYSDFYLEKTFHHEFSSILLRNYPDYIDKEKWINLNKVAYGNGGVEALKNSEAAQEFKSIYNSNGFLHQYATSDFENDFNSFAENLFHPSDKFYETVKIYPIIKAKFELMMKFYKALDRTFTKSYFIKIGKEYKIKL